MSTQDTLLIELGTEELPPKALKNLSTAFTAELLNGLLEAQLISQKDADAATPFASPRRLALLVPNVLVAQPDQTIERRGPAVKAAFKEDGQPSPAAMGFAKSCGVEVAELERLKTDKGEWLSYNLKQNGKSLDELITEIMEQSVKRLPIPKRMRWGDGTAEFVRPVKWLIVMYGERVIPSTLLDINSGNITRGHRFHSEGEIKITHADQYEKQLLNDGHVIADFDKRQNMILNQVNAAATSVKGHIEDDPALLDEVTGLVEYPTAVIGDFDDGFLEVPQECLISSMRDHQKYFHVVDAKGKLLAHFITVSNIESKNPEQVRSGNEKVLRARLSDAQFFWETDQKITLAERVERLHNVMFHAKLGSVLDKSKRIQTLAGNLASKMSGKRAIAERGALLAKADLVSDMVGEFDELQGIMGHYYADRDGEDALVGECVEQHYWPKFAGDQLPASTEAQAVALADKLDSLVGIYASGEIPTGDKDPYGLRRASLSILRILIEQQRPFNLSELVQESASVYQQAQNINIDAETQDAIVGFIRGRLTAHYQSQNIATTIINAVMACEPDSPLDFEHRVKAVATFSHSDDAANLAAANKRIGNILKKQKTDIAQSVDESLFTEDAEKDLFDAIVSIEQNCFSLFSDGDYEQGLSLLANLRAPVDNFFDNVMVMSDNPAEKGNRLALLQKMHAVFMRVADISLLQA